MGQILAENVEVYDNNSPREIKTLISYDPLDDSGVPDSKKFKIQKEFIQDILNVKIKKESLFKLSDEKPFSEVSTEPFSDRVIIHSWKNVENISARLVNSYDNSVILECLINKENGIYEEREFKASLFEDYEIKQGNLFYLRVFERKNEVRLEIHNDPGLTRIEDFPKMDFLGRYHKSRLYKDKKQI